MYILGLDTSSRDASIAVLKDDESLLECNFLARDNLSSLLIPNLEWALKTLALQISQIDIFGIGIGPGLFTGIRIGLATLKGLAFAAGKPVAGVTSLQALACKFAGSSQCIVPLIDAGKGEVYFGAYRMENGATLELLPPALLKIAELVPLLAQFPHKIFVGSGAEKHLDFIKKNFSDSQMLPRSNFLASEIGRIALLRFRRRQTGTDLEQILPFYLRKPDAETNRTESIAADD